MIQILLKALRDFPAWERPARWSLGLSLAALGACALIIIFGPDTLRLAAVIGAFGALVVLQAAILYSYRHMINELTQAQRAYLAGDYDTAARLLEDLRARGKARWKELSLLGMAYRQQGRLDDSLAAIEAAFAFGPDLHYPNYALGRTLLERGDYPGAAAAFEKALAESGPAEINLDLAEALWRAGDIERARAALEAFGPAPEHMETQRALLIALLRWRLSGAESPPADIIAAGLPGWLALESRCAGAPYGLALAADRAAFEQIAP